MGSLKQAVLYLIRKKGRSILLLVILFVIALFLLSSFSIAASAGKAADDLECSMGGSFIARAIMDYSDASSWIVKDTDTFPDPVQQYIGPDINDQFIKQVMTVEGIRAYNATIYNGDSDTGALPVWVDANLRPGLFADLENDESISTHEQEVNNLLGQSVIPNGNTDTSLNEMFRNGTFVLIKGRHINKEDSKKALISDDLAQRNGFQIGDTVTVECKTGFPVDSDSLMETIGEPIDLEIVGLFHSNFYHEPSKLTPESDYPENFLFVDLNTAALLAKNYYNFFYETDLAQSRYDNATFFVENPSELDAVIERVKLQSGIDWSDYEIEKDDTAYRASIAPINSIRDFSSGLTMAVMIGGAVVLSLIMSMWTKSRKHEIAILLSIGLRKAAIVGQHILEYTIVLLIVIGLLFPAAGPLVKIMNESVATISAGEETDEKFQTEGGIGSPVEIEKVSVETPKLSYDLRTEYFAYVFLICFGVGCISIFLSAITIIRLKPKDIISSI